MKPLSTRGKKWNFSVLARQQPCTAEWEPEALERCTEIETRYHPSPCLPKRNLLPPNCKNTAAWGARGFVLQSRNIPVIQSRSEYQIRQKIREWHKALLGVARGGFSTHVEER